MKSEEAGSCLIFIQSLFMLARIGTSVFQRRIFVSRIVIGALLLLMMVSESAQKDSIQATLLFAVGIFLIGIATVGRLWCSLYIGGYKNCDLIAAGSYSVTRNPLYFFSLLGFVGIGCATRTITFALLFFLVFAVIYPPVIKREEEYLPSKFARAYDDYCKKPPRFFPDLKALTEPDAYLVNPKQFRHGVGDVVWFVWMVRILKLFDALRFQGVLTPLFRLP